MNLLAADVIERFYTFLWPMLRISALLITAPIFSLRAVGVRVRVLLAVVLTWLVFPLHRWPVIDPVSAQGVVEICNQIMIGAVMGLIMQVVVAALVVAGQAIAASMGLAMANMIDPNMGNVPVLSQFLLLLASLVFVSTGGHVLLITLVLQSFESLPIGTGILEPAVYARVVRWSSMMFLGAVLLSLPVLVSLLFVNIGMGVVTRAAPSLNIFAVGFPAMILAGFLLLFLALDGMVERMGWLWLQGFSTLRNVMGLRDG